MLRRLCVVVAVVLTVLPASVVSAEITPPPADPTPDGRTPRQPRTSDGDSFFAPSTPAASIAPGNGETGRTAPAPVGVSRSRDPVARHDRPAGCRAHAGRRLQPRPPHPRADRVVRDPRHRLHRRRRRRLRSRRSSTSSRGSAGSCAPTPTTTRSSRDAASRRSAADPARHPGGRARRRLPLSVLPRPFGSVDANVVAVTDELGVQLIGWETSISDSAPRGTDPELQLEIAKRSLREGSIVLGHFGGTNSYEVLSALLAWLSDEGYRVGSVAELIAGNVEALAPNRGTAEVTVDVPGRRPTGRAR